jgi:hypothetical protein
VLIAALIVNGCVQAAVASWAHYQFVDAIQQEARFGPQKTTSELHRKIVDIGEEHSVPLAYNDITVESRGMQTTVGVSYVRTFELVPKVYMHEWTYNVGLNVYPLRPIRTDDAKSR